ncbi:hypothetical protein [Anaerocolumna chitinilytica]|uniref:Uncharacterized protein n=1 Tax=Anaerocolumna chitinilytica TaxID=1727145 RepID=A0A7M3SAH5_9FIRM|nr:hypothetical protein [Anaerocolumna chitinilytica]BCK01593.1 hypothetical protein bsdcttw_46330 [Anaerocolumna chitinilytica]
MNLEIYEFKENLVKYINTSSLPVSVKQMAVQDILNQLNTATANAINNERAEKEKAGEQANG